MNVLDAQTAQKNMDSVIERVSSSNEPILITGDHANAVLVSEAEWSSIQETLYLLGIPGMKESLNEGRNTASSDCSQSLDW
jgi:prevent-host-death family protein